MLISCRLTRFIKQHHLLLFGSVTDWKARCDDRMQTWALLSEWDLMYRANTEHLYLCVLGNPRITGLLLQELFLQPFRSCVAAWSHLILNLVCPRVVRHLMTRHNYFISISFEMDMLCWKIYQKMGMSAVVFGFICCFDKHSFSISKSNSSRAACALGCRPMWKLCLGFACQKPLFMKTELTTETQSSLLCCREPSVESIKWSVGVTC